MAGNKIVRKVSKKTVGKELDSVADIIDFLAEMIAEYFNQRYKIEKKVADVKQKTLEALYALKRNTIRTAVESIFLVTGILALIVGTVMLISKVIPIEYTLIFYGLVVCIGLMLTIKMKP